MDPTIDSDIGGGNVEERQYRAGIEERMDSAAATSNADEVYDTMPETGCYQYSLTIGRDPMETHRQRWRMLYEQGAIGMTAVTADICINSQHTG